MRPAISTFPNAAEWEATIERAIRATGRMTLRAVTVQLHQDGFVLLGRVPSYYEKQLAQATAQQIAGNRRIVNEIEVVGR